MATFIQALFGNERAEVSERIRLAMTNPSQEPPELTTASTPSSISSRLLETERSLAAAPAAPPQRRSRASLVVAASALSVLAAAAAITVVMRSSKDRANTSSTSASASSVAVAVPVDPDLRLCGSNTVGAELAPAIVEAFLKKKGASLVRRSPGPDPESMVLASELAGKPLVVDLRSRGTATAFEGLAAGTCDVGMASRPISDQEAAKLSSAGLGDMRLPASEHVIALDGIAVIVNPNATVKALDRDALHDIFTGKVSDWSALGAAAGPIKIYARDSKSGTFDVFTQLVLAGDELAPGARRFAESAALSDAVASDPAGIGFIGLAYTRSAKAVPVGERGASPMLATSFTVATESYLLSRRLFLYSTSKPRTPSWSSSASRSRRRGRRP
jgi:ABC-type phosphate transport system substrate-binding protein